MNRYYQLTLNEPIGLCCVRRHTLSLPIHHIHLSEALESLKKKLLITIFSIYFFHKYLDFVEPLNSTSSIILTVFVDFMFLHFK